MGVPVLMDGVGVLAAGTGASPHEAPGRLRRASKSLQHATTRMLKVRVTACRAALLSSLAAIRNE